MSRLDFEQHVVANDVDDEPVKGNFESIARLRVPRFERCVQAASRSATDARMESGRRLKDSTAQDARL
jgi:hypothetical protein